MKVSLLGGLIRLSAVDDDRHREGGAMVIPFNIE